MTGGVKMLLWQKVRRLIELEHMTHGEAAERCGFTSAGSISALANPKRKAKGGNQRSLERLAQGFRVPLIYFASDDPKDFWPPYLAMLSTAERNDLEASPVHRRAQWALAILERYYGDQYSVESVAATLDMDADDLRAQLNGGDEGYQMQSGLSQLLADLTGAKEWLLTPYQTIPDHLQRQYQRVSVKAFKGHVMPPTLDGIVDFLVATKEKVGGE